MFAARKSLCFISCCIVSGCRRASSSANSLPYPKHANPTPHQIFHLPRDATQEDVKTRYYELVRIYHPDSAVSRVLPSTIAQARFQAITSAYDVLRGKAYHPSAENVSNEVDRAKANFRNLETAMWKARQQRRAELRDGLGLDDRWKDAMMMGAVVLTVGAFIAQTYVTRREALQAQRDRSDKRKHDIEDRSLLSSNVTPSVGPNQPT